MPLPADLLHDDAPVRYGCVGVGMMGVEHIMNLLKIAGATVTAIADNHPDSIASCLRLMEEDHPGSTSDVAVFKGETAAKDIAASGLCDVCVVATPNSSHVEVLHDIIESGDSSLNILCEKPLCTTIEDCRKVIRLSQGRRGFITVGLEYSYMPPVCRLIRDCRAGTVGSIKMCSIREHRFPFLRKVRNWNRLNVNTGGTLVEKCCHFFDLFNRILAPARPDTVYASGSQSVNHLDEEADIFDNAYVVINYVDRNGTIVSRASLDLCMFAEASQSQEEVNVVGDKGKLEAFLPSREFRTGLRDKHSVANVNVEYVDDSRIKYYGHHYGSSYLEHLDVLARVHSLRSHQMSSGINSRIGQTAGLEQGLLSVAIGVAAHVSIEEERVVRVEEFVTEQELSACELYNVDEPGRGLHQGRHKNGVVASHHVLQQR